MKIQGFAAEKSAAELTPLAYDIPELGIEDVLIDITHCGICHSDIHLIDDDWQMSTYPFIPGHEIIGIVRDVGSLSSNLFVGQKVGVGWQCGACFYCQWCLKGMENLCDHHQPTCVGRHGGYADAIIVDSRFAFPIPDNMDSAGTAPLFCGGATVYSALKNSGVNSSSRVGVLGIGGLGHLALQFAKAMGAHVTAFSTSSSKEKEALSLGADQFLLSPDSNQEAFDVILSTVTASLDWEKWLSLIGPRGTLCFVGAAPGTIDVGIQSLVSKERKVSGSMIADRHTILEMLSLASRKDIKAVVEEYPLKDVNQAISRVRENKVHYRAVLTIS